MTTSIQADPKYLEEKRRQLQPYLDMFSEQLFRIYSIMPAPKRIYYYKTGEWEIINDPQWQQLIDKTIAEQNEFIENFFKQDNP